MYKQDEYKIVICL